MQKLLGHQIEMQWRGRLRSLGHLLQRRWGQKLLWCKQNCKLRGFHGLESLRRFPLGVGDHAQRQDECAQRQEEDCAEAQPR